MDDWPCHPRAWTNAKKKSLIASERDAWERAGFLLEQEDVDPADVVVIDDAFVHAFRVNMIAAAALAMASAGGALVITTKARSRSSHPDA